MSEVVGCRDVGMVLPLGMAFGGRGRNMGGQLGEFTHLVHTQGPLCMAWCPALHKYTCITTPNAVQADFFLAPLCHS